jgi:hypothetical protein
VDEPRLQSRGELIPVGEVTAGIAPADGENRIKPASERLVLIDAQEHRTRTDYRRNERPFDSVGSSSVTGIGTTLWPVPKLSAIFNTSRQY